MKSVFSILFTFSALSGYSQLSESEVLKQRKELLENLRDSTSGILKPEEINEFRGLCYFEFDTTYQINAKFVKNKGRRFKMATSTERKPLYRRYGYIHFTLNDSNFVLTAYQNIKLKKDPEYANYLFVPFRDSTCGKTTYGGGRYLDLRIPEDEGIILDFNLSYNPYCAYSYRYSCPVPPKENFIPVKILAGEKTPLAH